MQKGQELMQLEDGCIGQRLLVRSSSAGQDLSRVIMPPNDDDEYTITFPSSI